jgi:hypothetical protein
VTGRVCEKTPKMLPNEFVKKTPKMLPNEFVKKTPKMLPNSLLTKLIDWNAFCYREKEFQINSLLL